MLVLDVDRLAARDGAVVVLEPDARHVVQRHRRVVAGAGPVAVMHDDAREIIDAVVPAILDDISIKNISSHERTNKEKE